MCILHFIKNQEGLMKKKRTRILIITFLTLLILAAAVFFYQRYSTKANITQTIVEATCTEAGYIVTHDLKSSATSVQNLPALGHTFSDWVADEGCQIRTCKTCGYQESVRISTIDANQIPRLMLTGSLDGIGKKDKVALKAEFSGMEQEFQCYAIMTLQGHSTFGYPKHNYTVRFYDDDQSVSKHKLQFRNWNKEHKYILKANYVDQSQCRNLVGAQLWSRMVSCRDNLPERIAALPCYGAVDGFPINVYLNGEFFGLYTMNLHKDDDLYQMEDGEQAALLICNQQTTGESLFRERAQFLPDYSSDWEVEFCGTEDTAWACDSFNALIDFVMNSSDEEFRQKLPERLDVDAAIDYLIFIYSLGLQNSGAKDLVMLSFGDVWIPSAYDMDEAFGLDMQALSYRSAEDFVPEKADGIWSSGTGSLLWDRLMNLFEDEIRARYTFLRTDVLTEENIIGMVEEFTGCIPEASYDMDWNLYTDRPMNDPNMKKQITDYISQRIPILDSILEVSEE